MEHSIQSDHIDTSKTWISDMTSLSVREDPNLCTSAWNHEDALLGKPDLEYEGDQRDLIIAISA